MFDVLKSFLKGYSKTYYYFFAPVVHQFVSVSSCTYWHNSFLCVTVFPLHVCVSSGGVHCEIMRRKFFFQYFALRVARYFPFVYSFGNRSLPFMFYLLYISDVVQIYRSRPSSLMSPRTFVTMNKSYKTL